MSDTAKCELDPITGECRQHAGCYGRPLAPAPRKTREYKTVMDLPIARWAWREDGRDRQA